MGTLVALLLRFFPARFRREHGPDLMATFADKWRENAGWTLAARTIGDMFRSACLERYSQARGLGNRPAASAKGDGFMHTLWREARFGARTLWKAPAFSLIVLLTLTLGIGATSSIYSVVNAVLFKSLPYPNAERLVFINESLPKAPRLNVSWPDYVDWTEQNRVFTQMAAFRPDQVNVTVGDEPKAVSASWVTSSFFGMAGATPSLGRVFGEFDDRPGATPVAVLSYRFWRNDLSADPDIVGKQLHTASFAFVVAGVLGAGLRVPALGVRPLSSGRTAVRPAGLHQSRQPSRTASDRGNAGRRLSGRGTRRYGCDHGPSGGYLSYLQRQ